MPLRKLIDYQAAKDRQAEQFLAHQNAGDLESAHFVESPTQI